MKLHELGTDIVVAVSINDPVNTAIQDMWKLNIRHLPVVRGNKLVGIVSERDILFHLCWLDQDESKLIGESGTALSGASRVDAIMTRPPISLPPNTPLEEGARLILEKQISCVPLVKNDHIVGIVTEADFLRSFYNDERQVPRQGCRERNIAHHLFANALCLSPSDTCLTAICLMRDKQFRHIPIVAGDQLEGIISDRDVLRGGPSQGNRPISAEQLQGFHEKELAGIMSRNLVTLDLSATLADAAQKMVDHKIGALPVVEGNRLIGIITETDLLRALVFDCEMASSH